MADKEYKTYPILLTPTEQGYLVTVPDLNINTQGRTIEEAIYMAQDAIDLWCTTQKELGNPIPAPTAIGCMTREELDHGLQLGMESVKTEHTYTIAELDVILAEEFDI